jgi:hypothetical protein
LTFNGSGSSKPTTKLKINKSKFIQWARHIAHTCDPGYSGSSDEEDHSSRPGWTKVSETPSQQEQAGPTCDPSYAGGIGRRIVVQASSGPHSIWKITRAKKGWRHGLVVEHLLSRCKACAFRSHIPRQGFRRRVLQDL